MLWKKESFLDFRARKYVLVAIVFALVYLSFLMLKPYFVALVSAFILSFLVMPVHGYLSKRIGKVTSAVVSILAVLFVVVLPMALVFGSLTTQATSYLSNGGFEDFVELVSSNRILSSFGFNEISQLKPFAFSLLSSAVSHLPSIVLTIFIVVFGMYYFLVSWDKIVLSLEKYIPFRRRKVVSDISDVTAGLVYGSLLIGLIEFVFASAAFYFLGVESYLLLGAIIFFTAFLPYLGPAIGWVPVALYYLVYGDYATAIGVVVVGVVLSLAIDTILRAKVLGERARIHPFVMLLGILGGIPLFGLFGFIIGPLILAYTIEIFEEIMGRE